MKIGFIDYYLDEWHANNYPAMLGEVSGGALEVTRAFAKIDSPIGGLTTDEWCARYGVARGKTIDEVVKECDAVIVLSPDDCEMHEELCQIPLRSGKPVYVDKTFAPDKSTAERLFALAEANRTPCFSASALRYAEEYEGVERTGITAVSSWGTGGIETYAVHQLEPLLMLMDASVRRVMAVKSGAWVTLLIAFADGRQATVALFGNGCPCAFAMNIGAGSDSRMVTPGDGYFRRFTQVLADFLRTGKAPVPPQDTIAVMAVREAGVKALCRPGEWIEL